MKKSGTPVGTAGQPGNNPNNLIGLTYGTDREEKTSTKALLINC